MNPHSLVHALGPLIEPALDLYIVARKLLPFTGNEVGNDLLPVEQVDEKAAAWSQNPVNLLQHPEVLYLAFEIAEGSEEVEYPIEGLVGERQTAHVGGHAGQARRLGQQGQRQIHTECPEPAAAQDLCMPTRATGQIQNSSRVLA
ncbi:MAG: hypothetical protein P8127_16035, partial [Acidobacteriota bacterium]